MTAHPPWRAGTLARRVVLSQAAVIGAMAVTVLIVAVIVGPAVFTDHLQQAGHVDQPLVLQHAREAFVSAGLLSLGGGVVVAVLGALALSRGLTLRIATGLAALERGAERVASGHYDEPVVMPPGHRELEAVAGSFNAMAAQLASTESRRRRLLTDVAHELRTPLATIDVALESWEEGLADPDAGLREILRAQSKRVGRLAEDIRDVSAAEEGRLRLDPVPTSTDALVTAALAAAGPRYADAGVALTSAGPDLRVLADPARVGQVLDNLLANALRHTPAGGRVRVRVVRSGDAASIEVTDEGEGIAADDLPHVFERFYRAGASRSHARGEGTGVGLAISRAIALAHDGDLRAASPGPGGGATFTLTLPLAG